MLRTIDLFCGAGGMSLGFERAGFKTKLAVDNDFSSIATFRANFPSLAMCEDVERLVRSGAIPEADAVIGGPPCQGFSLLNKRRLGDARRSLWQPFMDAVELSGARAFVIENVPGLIGSEEAERIAKRAATLGFEVEAEILNAADYGVPQTRRRAFIVGRMAGTPPIHFPPDPTHAKNVEERSSNLRPWKTVREAIADLPEPIGTEVRKEPPPFDLHFGRNPTAKSVARYRAVPPGGNRFDLQRNAPELTPDCWIRKTSGGTDLFGRLWWERPSVTIRTEFFKPEKGRYLHPEEDRPITHREAARIMDFPDNFAFRGSKIDIARQIGNAVPPALAEAVARAVAQHLDQTATEREAA